MNSRPTRKQAKIIYLPRSDRSWRGAVVNRRGGLLLVLAALYFSALFVSQHWRLVQVRRGLAGIEREISIVSGHNNLLTQEIEKLHSPAYLEKLARQELGMVRPGEILFFFRETDREPAQGR